MNERNDNDSIPMKDNAPLRKQWYLNRDWRFLAFNALFVLLFFEMLRDLVQFLINSDNDNYIPLIPFISAYLVYSNRKIIFSEKESSSVAGLLTMGVGILFLVIVRNQKGFLDYRDYLALLIFSLLSIWIGGFILSYGMRSFREAAFPVLFLFFMIPVPSAAQERIILFLQTGSAEAAYGFLQAAGVPVARDGFIFHLSTIDIEVAKQCSGIHSSLALVITGALAGYYFLRRGWTRSLLMISIVPIAVLKNGFRIATLSILGVYVDERILDSNLHRKGGIVFFILALGLVWAVIVLLRKAEGKFVLKDKNLKL